MEKKTTVSELDITPDFVAGGTAPTWSVEIDLAQAIRFSFTDPPHTIVAQLQPTPLLTDGNEQRYQVKTKTGKMEVIIRRETCADAATGRELPYRVEAYLEDEALAAPRNFTGCGRYVKEADNRLHDIWALQELDGQPIETDEIVRERPYIELNVANRAMLGNGGCNQIRGGIILKEEQQLTFGPIVSTKRACPALALEAQLLQAMSGATYTYTLANLRLTLENDDHRIVFRKVD